MITLLLVFKDFQSKTNCLSVLSGLLVVIFHSEFPPIRITYWKIYCDRRHVSQCVIALKKGFHLLATLNSSLNNHGEYIIGLAVLYWVKAYPNVQQGHWNYPLCTPNQLGTKYPSVPTVTSWYLHALWVYLRVRGEAREGGGEGGGRRGRARISGWGAGIN